MSVFEILRDREKKNYEYLCTTLIFFSHKIKRSSAANLLTKEETRKSRCGSFSFVARHASKLIFVAPFFTSP